MITLAIVAQNNQNLNFTFVAGLCEEQKTLKDPCQTNSLYRCNCFVQICVCSAGPLLRPDIEELSSNVNRVKTKGEQFSSLFKLLYSFVEGSITE